MRSGQGESRQRVEPLVHVRQTLRVLVDGLPDFLVAVAQVQRPALARAVDVLFAVDVPHAHAVAVMQDRAAARAAADHQVLLALTNLVRGHAVQGL